MKDYECHITVAARDDRNRREMEALGSLTDWKSSFIEGDPDLGVGERLFFTKHYSDLNTAYEETEKFANIIMDFGTGLLRKKIEEVLMDTRNNTWRLK